MAKTIAKAFMELHMLSNLSKAFDSFSYKILLDKLKNYSFHGYSLKLFESY